MAYMTQEGYDKMVAQLRHMETVDRPAASAAIAEARDKGDLSENSEYDAAKEAQGMLEMKINNLKAAIAEAKIIDASKLRSRDEKRQERHGDEIHHRERKRSQPARRQNILNHPYRTRTVGKESRRRRGSKDSARHHPARDSQHFGRKLTELTQKSLPV